MMNDLLNFSGLKLMKGKLIAKLIENLFYHCKWTMNELSSSKKWVFHQRNFSYVDVLVHQPPKRKIV